MQSSSTGGGDLTFKAKKDNHYKKREVRRGDLKKKNQHMFIFISFALQHVGGEKR